MKSIDVKSNSYDKYNIVSNANLKFKIGDRVRISKSWKHFCKRMYSNWSGEFLNYIELLEKTLMWKLIWLIMQQKQIKKMEQDLLHLN